MTRLVTGASIEAGHCLSGQVGSVHTSERSRDANASRNSRRMIERLGLRWKIPISELIFEVEGHPIVIPYISPIDLMKYLLECHREILLGGFKNLDDGVDLLKGWWQNFQRMQPTHQVFQHRDSQELGYTVPLYLYGDEGKGKKRGNTAVFSIETPFGLHTALQKRDGKHCLDCKKCCPTNQTVEKFKPLVEQPAERDTIGFATTNFKEHSFLSRFLLWVVPCELYKTHPGLIPFIMGKISKELRTLFLQGVVVQNQTWTFAIAGMKGDSKWHNSMGNFVRHFGTKGRKRSLLMCYECLAGSDSRPYEDVSFSPSWKDSVYTTRPWDVPPPVSIIPHDSMAGERLFKRDIFHIMKLGCMRHYVGSVLVSLIAWNYFRILPAPAEGNSADVQLQRAFGHFRLWCHTFSKTPSLRSFSRRLFNWPNYRTYAWANTKGSDTYLLCQWLVTLLEQLSLQPLLDPSHGHMFTVMIHVGRAALEFFRLLYPHYLFLPRGCAMCAYEHGTRFLHGYAWLAEKSLNDFGVCAWAMIPKIHMLRHTTLELQASLEAGSPLVLSPLATACDQNEDLIGKLCSLYLKVQSRYAMRRVLELYLVKVRVLQRRVDVRLRL